MYTVMGRTDIDEPEEIIEYFETQQQAEDYVETIWPAWYSVWIESPRRRPNPDYEPWLTFEQGRAK